MVVVKKDSNNNNPKVVGGIIGAVLLVLAAVVGVPYMTASSWKSSTLDKTNTTIDELNKSNRDISLYSNKLQPSDSDYSSLVAAYQSQLDSLNKAKSDLKPVGGFAGLDLTGTHKKATEAHDKLVATYDKMIALDTAGLNRSKAAKDVAATMANISLDSPEQAKSAATAMHDAAAKIKSFASSADGTENDKGFGTALENAAAALDKMVAAAEANDEAAVEAAYSEFETAATSLDDYSQKAEEDTKAEQKKSDALVSDLNAAVKSLE